MLDANVGDHGLATQDRAWLRARAAGQPIAPYREPTPADLSAVESLPRTYIVCTGDPQFPLPARVEVVKFGADHWPMATKPAELTAGKNGGDAWPNHTRRTQCRHLRRQRLAIPVRRKACALYRVTTGGSITEPCGVSDSI